MLERQANVNFPIGVGGNVSTFPLLSRMLQFSHSTKMMSHMWKTRLERKRMFMNSLVDSMLNIGLFNVSLNCWMMKHDIFFLGKSTN